MEIALKQSYSKIVSQVANYQNSSQPEGNKSGQKKMQTKPQQKNIGDAAIGEHEQGFVFVDTTKKSVALWVKKTMKAYQSLVPTMSKSLEEDGEEVMSDLIEPQLA